jgi:HK97 family phage major capsid protein
MAFGPNDATTTGDFAAGFFTPEQSAPIFEKAKERSVVQQLARQIPMGINGVNVPIYTGDVTAEWVAETGVKPITQVGATLVNLVPHKLAVIALMSNEIVRANPVAFQTELRAKIGEAIAVAFDAAALRGTNSPFGVGINLEATTKEQPLVTSGAQGTFGTSPVADGGMYRDLVEGWEQVLADPEADDFNGFAFDKLVQPKLALAVDTTGRPIFLPSVAAPLAGDVNAIASGSLIGFPAFFGRRIAEPTADGSTVGYGGDWSKAVWGAVGGISWRVSTEATVLTADGSVVSLFQRNMSAVLAEAEYAFYVHNPSDNFVKYTNQSA